MNLKTTIALLLLVGVGAGAWTWLEYRKPVAATTSDTLTFLQTKLTPAKITRIEATRKEKTLDPSMAAASTLGLIATGQGPWVSASLLYPRSTKTLFVLEKTGNEWSLPGNWPVRPAEVEQWVAVLSTLNTRFAPIGLDEKSPLKAFGLDDDPLTIKITVGDETHTLRFGEQASDTRSFTAPTFVRLDDKQEVIHLGPGVFAALNRSQEYFQKTRLFPHERIARDEDAKEKVEQLAATSIDVVTKDAKYSLGKKNGEWVLLEAHKKKESDKKEPAAWQRLSGVDRLDPAKRDALLRAFPDLWAEKFAANKGRSLESTGLSEPEYVFTVARPGGAQVKLLIGKISHKDTKIGFKKMGNQLIPTEEGEEFRYAKLDKNEQIFEIKTDKLRDIGVAPEDLRDPMLTRFKKDDVKRLKVRHGTQELVFVKTKEKADDKDAKEKWRLDKPAPSDIESSALEDFIEKLAATRVSEKEMLAEADLKKVGLDKPVAQIMIVLEETDKDAPKAADPKSQKKKTRIIVLQLGVKEKDKDNFYVRVDDWPRINQLDNDLLKLAERSEVAYRPRELWKLADDEIKKITIQADGAPYNLERADKGWKITGAVESVSAGPELELLAEELARLRVERFEAKEPKDLAKFGLDKPAFRITFAGKDGKPRTLQIGSKIASKEGGRFARLENGDAVFVLNEKFAGNLRRDAFDLLDKNLLPINPASVERIRYQGPAPFDLEVKGNRWQVTKSPAGEFTADNEMIKNALSWLPLRAEKYVAVGAKIDWAMYGLAPPAITVTVSARPDEKAPDKKPSEHVVELGKDVEGGGRYARIDKKDAVVVLDVLVVDLLTRTHLDFLDPRVLRFDGDAATSIERKMPGADLELTKREDSWQITKPGLRDADNLTVFDLLRRTSTLRANRIAEYPAKDLKAFGLDKPAAVVTINVELDGNATKHVIKLGDPVKNAMKKATGERYAIIEGQKMVLVLSAELSRHLAAPALYFADRNLASFSSVDQIEMTRPKRKAVFSRTDKDWEMTQPTSAAAEGPALEDLIRAMQRLRADEIVAEKTADLKKYGLDQPAAQWRFKSGGVERLHLIVGAVENDQPGARRFARLGDKNTIFLLNGKIAAKTLGEFRGRQPSPSFEIVKATSVIVALGKDKPFTLEKKDKEWRIAGDPKSAVKADEVLELLATVASLRALHYVADTKADLKAFGLTPPSVKIEVQLPVGKREVWLGGFEDKSKRYYATVPGTDAVFVIEELDGSTLARPLSAYVLAEKKK